VKGLQAGLLGLALSMVAIDGAAAVEKLSRTQLLKLFPGTYGGVASDGTRIRIMGRADGTIRGIADQKHDQGRWSVEGNALCIQWTFWLGAMKRCGAVHRDGPWYVAVKKDGSARMKFRR
jgi:hypothetical protein